MSGLSTNIYCFEIKLQDGRKLHLTDCNKFLSIDGKIFLPNSGVTIKEGWFNDSAKNYIILEGIFELNGIESQMDLTDSIVKIYAGSADYWNHFVTYQCCIYTKSDLGFIMRLESNIGAYNQSIVQSFSKNCRASFGDNKCKIDKIAYSQIYNIKEIFAKTIIIANIDKENGYFNYGDAILGENQFSSKIINHLGNLITLDKIITDNVTHIKIVKLIAGCDKNFITCCNKFDNAVNFRGEPLIPDENFIKVA